jgi:hypothetical protein
MYCCFVLHYSENNKEKGLLEKASNQMMKNGRARRYRLANEMYILVDDVNLEFAWQIALQFECEGVPVGYGVGTTEKQASQSAKRKWIERLKGEQKERLSM